MSTCGACIRAASSSADATFIVATNGNNQWSGTLPAPNAAKTDGPFATVDRAVEACRKWRQGQSHATQACTIALRGGTWFLAEPLIIRSEDSNLTIEAYGGEKPVLSGGRKITGWKTIAVNGRKMWVANVPEAREGDWFFHELWVNGKRAVRARHPNKGYLSVASLPDATADWTHGHSRFGYAEGDLKLGMENSESKPAGTWTNGEVLVMTRWIESRLPISSVDATQRVMSFSKRSVFQLAPGDPYYLENLFEALDEPGEWFLEKQSGRLVYLPRAGERLEDIEAIAPLLGQIIRLEGLSAEATDRAQAAPFISRLTFRRLTFSHTEWCFPEGFSSAKDRPNVSPAPDPNVGGFAQAAVGVPAAVYGEGLRECAFEECNFLRLGTYGLDLRQGCQSNRIVGCEFADLGAGGLKIGETVLRGEPARQTRGNEIADCHIHDGGLLFASAVGIWIGHSPENRIVHNSIHDFYYTGISVGWSWGYGPAMASNNLVQFNEVHHIGVKSDGDGPILSDLGGIYTLGLQPGTKIVNNLWHDIAAIRYGGWGIYFDEGSSGILAASNVVYRTTHGGFHQHYGETNMVWNNVFAFGRDAQLQRTRPEPHRSFSFATNIVYFDSGGLLAGDWSDDNYEMDRNMYFDVRLATNSVSLMFAGVNVDAWRKRGHDLNSVLANPDFVAPGQHDFHVKAGSPALALGFRPIYLTDVGPRRRRGTLGTESAR